jgi:hypothetical protein
VFGRIRLYAAYIDPASLEPDRAAALVKQGMCWPAFFFSVLWALWHRLWGTAVLILVAVVALNRLSLVLGADEQTSGIATLGLVAFIGVSANDWRGRALERRGRRLAAIVAAPNSERAVQRLFENGEAGLR